MLQKCEPEPSADELGRRAGTPLSSSPVPLKALSLQYTTSCDDRDRLRNAVGREESEASSQMLQRMEGTTTQLSLRDPGVSLVAASPAAAEVSELFREPPS